MHVTAPTSRAGEERRASPHEHTGQRHVAGAGHGAADGVGAVGRHGPGEGPGPDREEPGQENCHSSDVAKASDHPARTKVNPNRHE